MKRSFVWGVLGLGLTACLGLPPPPPPPQPETRHPVNHV